MTFLSVPGVLHWPGAHCMFDSLCFVLQEHQQTCNVMMIEQVLAIPTSAGGTSQATIQIPTNMGHGGQIILDSQAITMDGQTISMKKNGGVIMMSGGGLTNGRGLTNS